VLESKKIWDFLAEIKASDSWATPALLNNFQEASNYIASSAKPLAKQGQHIVTSHGRSWNYVRVLTKYALSEKLSSGYPT
jgi:hypothetical protein